MRIREHVYKASKPKKFAESQLGPTKGPRGAGVPPMDVQKPKRVGSKVRPPKKHRGG